MRIRSIKPELWTDARTGEWDARLTLFFVGLWQVADDSGRLRLDPRLLRADLDPFDTKFGGTRGVGELLDQLVGLGRILPYQVGGDRFGLVANFARHQVINKPSKSRLPAPPEGLRESSGSPPSRVLPESGVEGSREQGKEQGAGSEEQGDPGCAGPSDASRSVEESVLDAWNSMAKRAGLPRCLGSAKVRKTIRARAKASGWLEAFRLALAHVETSDFHRGKNDRGWRADLEHLLQDGRAEQLAAKQLASSPATPAAPDFTEANSGAYAELSLRPGGRP